MEINSNGAIKEYMPPILLRCFSPAKFRKYGWFGDYQNWAEAKHVSTGYDARIIIEKVKDAALKVKNGLVAYERDSVLFETIEYSWPLVAGLMWIAANKDGKLNIIDFGGSLGTTYFQNRVFLKTLKDIKWNIIEQKHFVECGSEYFENDILKFYVKIEDCMEPEKPSAILLSSVIQYLESPYVFLRYVIEKNFEYILIDKTSFLLGAKRDRITVQRVDPCIYEASYPCWFFNEELFLDIFKDRYQLITDFRTQDRANIPSVFKGFIFKNKKNV